MTHIKNPATEQDGEADNQSTEQIDYTPKKSDYQQRRQRVQELNKVKVDDLEPWDLIGIIPVEMRDAKRWITWQGKLKEKDGKEKLDKVPCRMIPNTDQIMGISVQDSSYWLTFDKAYSNLIASDKLDGIGFVLGDGFVGVDFDKCADHTSGELAPWAKGYLDKIDSYAEYSPSGTGIKAIIFADAPEKHPNKRTTLHSANLEIYSKGRFFTITGAVLPGKPSKVNCCQEVFDGIIAQLSRTPAEKSEPDPGKLDREPKRSVAEILNLIADDAQSTDAATKERAERFLLRHNAGAQGDDLSADDMGYFNTAAYYTDNNPDLMKSLYFESALVRGKSNRVDYIERTIAEALTRNRRTYSEQDTGDHANPFFPWPDPVDLFATIPAPAFPIQVLPEVMQNFCTAESEQSGFDVGAYAFALLAIGANAIDHRARLKIGSLQSTPNLWMALAGDSGKAKTPILKSVMQFYREINSNKLRKSAEELARWKELCKKANSKKDSDGKTPPRPLWKQRITTDTTVEGLAKILADNPEGLIIDSDEMTSFIGRMDAYSGKNSGSKDRGDFLQSYDGGQKIINRASRDDAIVVPNFVTGIITGVQPELLAQMMKVGSADGLFQRFLVYNIAQEKNVSLNMTGADSLLTANMRMLFDRIERWNIQEAFINQAFVLDADGIEFTEEYHNTIRGLKQTMPSGRFVEHLSKFPGFLGRLTLALHCIEEASTPREEDAGLSYHIGGETVLKAIHILKILFRHSEAIYDYMEKANGQVRDLVKNAAEAILSKNWSDFQRGDLTRDATHWQGANDQHSEHAINLLIEYGWIRDITPPVEPGKRGRRSSGRFEVNPKVKERFTTEIERISRRRRQRYELIQKAADSQNERAA